MNHPCRRAGDLATRGHESTAQVLRQRAEMLFHANAGPAAGFAGRSPTAMDLTMHELCVHQIELEMQNEELRQTQAALDVSRARYFDLYDLAPVGYFSLSEQGMIIEANLAAANLLGLAKGMLIGRPITRFMRTEDADTFYLHCKALLETGQAQACNLRMVKHDGTPLWVCLSASAAPGADGVRILYLVLIDISARKEAEAQQALLDQILREKNAELQRAKLAAENANRAKSDFLSSRGLTYLCHICHFQDDF